MEAPPSYDDIVRYPSVHPAGHAQSVTTSVSNSASASASATYQYQQRLNYQQQQQQSQQQYQYQQNYQQQQHQQPPILNTRRPKLDAVPLYENSTERRRVSELADLFAIIKVTESLEAAYSRDAVSSNDYAEACSRLLSHFKSTESALITAGIISSAKVFFREFSIDCPRAYDRLLVSGVPATVLHGEYGSDRSGGQGSGASSASGKASDSVVVAEIVQAFITAIDALALENYAVDMVQPLLADLMGALTRVSSLPPDFEALVKLRLWLQKLNEMRAYEELNAEEARQLKFDLERSYEAFMKHLSSRSSL